MKVHRNSGNMAVHKMHDGVRAYFRSVYPCCSTTESSLLRVQESCCPCSSRSVCTIQSRLDTVDSTCGHAGHETAADQGTDRGNNAEKNTVCRFHVQAASMPCSSIMTISHVFLSANCYSMIHLGSDSLTHTQHFHDC